MTETTAHTLAATLGLLALNDDVQDEIYLHIVSVIGYDHDPVCASSDSYSYVRMWIFSFIDVFQVFDDHAKLDKVRAAFYEGVRMFRRLLIFKYTFLS